MNTKVSKDYLFAFDDLMSISGIQLLIKSSYTRIRRPAALENFMVALPGFNFDFYRMAQQYRSRVLAFQFQQLPYTASITERDLAVLPISSYDTMDIQALGSKPLGFSVTPLITADGTAFTKNSFSLDFKPINTDDPAENHPYKYFNHLLHRAMIQPGIVLMPYVYDKTATTFNFSKKTRTYGPVVLTSASIGGNETGITANATFAGGTSISGVYTPSQAYLDFMKAPSREAGLVDTVILIEEAENYFDGNNLFRTDKFEAEQGGVGGYTQSDVDRPEKRIVEWSLKINNNYEFTMNMPGDTTSIYSQANNSIPSEIFISSDAAGQRYASLKDRTVTGTITFLTERIDGSDTLINYEDDYLKDNTDTRKMIIAVTPQFYFPMTNIQFGKGKTSYNSQKALRVTYPFIARISKNGSLSLTAPPYAGPSSEFGYTYNINFNELFGSLLY